MLSRLLQSYQHSEKSQFLHFQVKSPRRLFSLWSFQLLSNVLVTTNQQGTTFQQTWIYYLHISLLTLSPLRPLTVSSPCAFICSRSSVMSIPMPSFTDRSNGYILDKSFLFSSWTIVLHSPCRIVRWSATICCSQRALTLSNELREGKQELH